uniref:Uncharacterized protein n=1 Tax=Solanum lycopersicum TaxID=4081 RepID=A0A3Q7I179_SOLLC|nr:uncharacterized protein LOC101253416 [Solanum lycopersicum]
MCVSSLGIYFVFACLCSHPSLHVASMPDLYLYCMLSFMLKKIRRSLAESTMKTILREWSLLHSRDNMGRRVEDYAYASAALDGEALTSVALNFQAKEESNLWSLELNKLSYM